MKPRSVISLCAVLLWLLAVPTPAPAQEAWIWIDRGDRPILDPGDEARVYFRVAHDGHVAVVHLDPRGVAHLLYPVAPGGDDRIRGGHDYRVLFSGDPIWKVSGASGAGHFFLLVAERPLDFAGVGRTPTGAWDLRTLAPRPYTGLDRAMDEFVEALLPEWSDVPFHLTYTTYRVGSDARLHESGPPSRPVLQRRLPGGMRPGGG